MSDDPKRFKVIEGGNEPKAFRARKQSDPEPLACWACQSEKSHSGAVTMTVKLGEMIKDGRPCGGTKAVICVHCLARGQVTVLI